jgi:hypothetical protein
MRSNTAEHHPYFSFNYEKVFVFLIVTMVRTLLTIEKEKIFSAIPRFDLVGDPVFDQSDFVELA